MKKKAKKRPYRRYPQDLVNEAHNLYDFGCSRDEIKAKCSLNETELGYVLYTRVPSSEYNEELVEVIKKAKAEAVGSAPKLPRKKTILESFFEFFTLKEHK